MIVHKATMGVLDRVYTGENLTGQDGVAIPVMVEAKLKDFPWLNSEEWWEVRDPALQRRLRRYYPNLYPVIDENGELVDVDVFISKKDREAEKKARAEALAEAQARGYKRICNLRRTGLMPFLLKGGSQ